MRGNFVHVHLVALGPEADAGQFRLKFLKHARYHHRFDGADVVNQAFRVVAFGAGAGKIRLFQPEPRNPVVGGKPVFAVNVPEQPHAGKRIGLINLVANFGQVRAARDEFGPGVECAGPRRGILKRTGIGGNGGEQTIGNRFGDRPARDLEQTKNQFAGGRFARGNPVDVAVARVAFVMVNVDENFPVHDAPADFAQPFETCAIGGDDTVEFHPGLRLLKQSVRVEKFVFLRHGILVPADDLFALVLQAPA